MGSVQFWITILFCSVCNGGKILVVPLEGSHWLNMDLLIKTLHGQGHSIDVIRNHNSWFVKENSTYYNSITIPDTKGLNEEMIDNMILKEVEHERRNGSLFSAMQLFVDTTRATMKMQAMICRLTINIFENEEIMDTLQKKQYDVMLTDPVWGAGIMLAHKLKLPMVYNVRWTATGEGHFDIAPSPLSYIPVIRSGNSDRMSFFQRVKNVVFYLLIYIQYSHFNLPQYQALCDKYFDPPVNFYKLLQGADIWLMRVDFVFEFPRPTMPNIIYIGGFHCRPSKALPPDLEDFMLSSGDHGVIVMSLGTFISNLPSDVTEEIAAAFAQLPQKVIWRYTGKKPSALGNNTLLVDWMPQNDLLGHPKTKVFVAHGGTNGVQEAVYHGVPVVGIPFFFDQYDNLLRLQDRGAAKILSLGAVGTATLHAALEQVINDPSYKRNMKKLSELHRDKPVQPMDSAIFWIEYVMRHKGAAHLRTESYQMPWYSYHSVDVAVVLSAFVLFITSFICITAKYLFLWCCSRKRKTE